MRFAPILFSAVALLAVPPAARADAVTRATVVHVDDGDTIDVRIGGRRERVRYIGIDAPEVAHGDMAAEAGGEVAKAANQRLLAGGVVTLEFGAQRRDRYGRLLAYVWAGGAMINLEMVRRGYARAIRIPPNLRYAAQFEDAETAARAAHRGLWESASAWPARLREGTPAELGSPRALSGRRAADRRRDLVFRNQAGRGPGRYSGVRGRGRDGYKRCGAEPRRLDGANLPEQDTGPGGRAMTHTRP